MKKVLLLLFLFFAISCVTKKPSEIYIKPIENADSETKVLKTIKPNFRIKENITETADILQFRKDKKGFVYMSKNSKLIINKMKGFPKFKYIGGLNNLDFATVIINDCSDFQLEDNYYKQIKIIYKNQCKEYNENLYNPTEKELEIVKENFYNKNKNKYVIIHKTKNNKLGREVYKGVFTRITMHVLKNKGWCRVVVNEGTYYEAYELKF